MRKETKKGKKSRPASGFAAGILLVCSLSMTAFAADDSTNIGKGQAEQTASTSLSYNVTPDYTVVIPREVSLSSKDITMQITATKINAEPNYQVQVKVSGGLTEGKVKLVRTNDTGYEIYAPLKLGDNSIDSNTAVAAFMEHDTTALPGTGTLTFGAPADAGGSTDIKAGDYTGTVTFQVAYTLVASTGK
ncbi:hypothetical protein DWX43_07520 [Clostridium sp. AF19-22AC]|jgi:hypothetical protein|uniref:hypothetical protein n=1 Tax=Clostridia TaxID=186801 RepID=UPI000E47214C|nr:MULTISPECIES: hypothetical protein [Clostridia]RHR30699.1 hypothetical protein DWX43_07520 [Clostridium sp. AF19-22AC]